MAGKRNKIVLEQLTSNDAYALLDEIPSDTGSVTSSAPSEDEIDFYDEDDKDTEENTNAEEQVIRTPELDSEWESEDDLPLELFRKRCVLWSKEPLYATQPIPFTEDFGPNIPDEIESPTDTICYLLTEHLLKTIVFETNLYATQKHGDRFTPTTLEEVKCFLGINIMMGITKKPSYKDYWSSKFEIWDPFISSVMSRNRFSWLLGNIHVNNNLLQPKKGADGFDKLYKIRPMIDTLGRQFLECYNPGENQSVDDYVYVYCNILCPCGSIVEPHLFTNVCK